MSRVKKPLQILLALVAATQITACSKTVQWEEEVPLNTGETIWVKRSMPWVFKGGYGNPFDMSMSPTGEQTIRFKYAGTEYSFTGRAHVLWIAISPARQPVLVAPAADYGWASENSYTCVIPYYVQLVPDTTGKRWTWPKKIEPWLYELPANVMASIPQLSEKGQERYTTQDRNQRDATYRLQSCGGRQISPLYEASSGCISNYKPSFSPNLNWNEK
jgi:hypothetical protein